MVVDVSHDQQPSYGLWIPMGIDSPNNAYHNQYEPPKDDDPLVMLRIGIDAVTIHHYHLYHSIAYIDILLFYTISHNVSIFHQKSAPQWPL